MNALNYVVGVIFILICAVLVVLVLLQEGKSQGLGAIQGSVENTYWSKNKKRSKEAVIQYAQDHGLDFSDYEKLLQTEQIKELIYKEVNTKDSTANGFRICERIAKIALLPNSFKVGEELSAKQEMMRFKIVEKYASLIATLF